MNQERKAEHIDNTRQLGKILKDLRKKQKITQAQLAEFANISVTSIGEIERGEVDVRFGHLLKILKLSGGKLTIEYMEAGKDE